MIGIAYNSETTYPVTTSFCSRFQISRYARRGEGKKTMPHRDPGMPSIWQFFDPNSPWVLVHEGSIKGRFDFVPRHLRVGPWASLATVYIAIIVAKVFYWMPLKSSFQLDDEILSTHPIAYTSFWVYNLVVFFWMKFVLVTSMRNSGPWILFTYTIQSWTMLTIRHGLSALAPFLPRKHFLLWINELLRFPALATASITFFFWNFAIAPAIYYNFDPKRRREFLRFNLSFRLVQVHLFNIIFAIMNTIVVSAREFQFVDLWCGLAGAVGYAMLYLLILDRVGVHLYPIFSPRTLWSVLSWTAAFGTYFAIFYFWNFIISTGKLTMFDS